MKKHVVVTGGSRGLGLAIVRCLLEAGYRVTSVSRKITRPLEALRERFSGDLAVVVADLGDAVQLGELIVRLHQGPRTFALINNAAIGIDGLLVCSDVGSLSHAIRVNFDASIFLARAVAKSMIRSREGRIINIGSIVTSRAYRGLAVYAATKAGLEGFTRVLAQELGPRRITVNAVAPGFMRTDMTASLTEERRSRIVARTPIPGELRPEHVTSIILYLLSAEAEMLTGCVIPVDGGARL